MALALLLLAQGRLAARPIIVDDAAELGLDGDDGADDAGGADEVREPTLQGGGGEEGAAGGGGGSAKQDPAKAVVVPNPQRVVVLYTQFGPLPIKLLSDIAPRTTKLVWELAEGKECKGQACIFYRNEAKPRAGSEGPPYALLQVRAPYCLPSRGLLSPALPRPAPPACLALALLPDWPLPCCLPDPCCLPSPWPG